MTDAVAARVSVAFRTLGCKVNRVESESIAADLLGRGVSLVAEADAAVVVINTCTVTSEADAKARKAVRQALAAEGEPVVVVTGCLAALDAEALEALGERVVVEADKSRVALRVASLLALEGMPHVDAVRSGVGFRTRAMLKVEDGCDAFCSYCIVPFARGGPRAVPLADVVAQARDLVDAGVREIVLTGINIGRYADGTTDLADVIAAVAGTGVSRLRLSSIEPLDLTPRLLGVIAETPAFCPHLHVPLQSGSDSLLAEMGRTYTAERFADRIEAARAALPGLAVTTDVLAGFPGETDAQAAETLAFCESIGFAKLHVFRYSRRKGTAAAARLDQVADASKSARARALRELGFRAAEQFALSRLAQSADVLVENVESTPAGTALAVGMTPDYLRVRFEARGACIGDLVTVRLVKVEGDKVVGEQTD